MYDKWLKAAYNNLLFLKMNSGSNVFFSKYENCQHKLGSIDTMSVSSSMLEVWFSHLVLQLQYFRENKYGFKKPTTTKIKD